MFSWRNIITTIIIITITGVAGRVLSRCRIDGAITTIITITTTIITTDVGPIGLTSQTPGHCPGVYCAQSCRAFSFAAR